MATAKIHPAVCLLAGRTKAIRKFHEHTQGFQDAEINARLVAYCSDQAHSSVEKAALIGLVRMRFIEADGNLGLRGGALKEAIEEDIKNGLIPFWVSLQLSHRFIKERFLKIAKSLIKSTKIDIEKQFQTGRYK
jgi:histidine decarboxylase